MQSGTRSSTRGQHLDVPVPVLAKRGKGDRREVGQTECGSQLVSDRIEGKAVVIESIC